jgi:Zn-dependent oligopeptidase
MNTYIKTPIDYKTINWNKISPASLLISVKYHYKNTIKDIKKMEKQRVSDQEYLKQIDEVSRNIAQFCNLLFFLVKSGKTEYAKIENKVQQMQLKVHYRVFSNKKIYENFKVIKKKKISLEDKHFINVINKTFLYSGVEFSEKNKQKMKKNDQQLSKAQMKYHFNCAKDSENLKLVITQKEYDLFLKQIL